VQAHCCSVLSKTPLLTVWALTPYTFVQQGCNCSELLAPCSPFWLLCVCSAQ
jgi:hypothetical protein